jgi:AcrR family transcriptional regulator
VAEVMKAAGLTHGAFYAHFDSKEKLQVAAVARPGLVPRSRLVFIDQNVTARITSGLPVTQDEPATIAPS